MVYINLRTVVKEILKKAYLLRDEQTLQTKTIMSCPARYIFITREEKTKSRQQAFEWRSGHGTPRRDKGKIGNKAKALEAQEPQQLLRDLKIA